jgi:hypothetical protein
MAGQGDARCQVELDLPWVLIQVAAWLHLFQIPGVLLLDRHVVRVGDELFKLTELARGMVMVITSFVIAVLLALGILIGSFSSEVLCSQFGKALAGFLGLFWLARLGVQLWYYHVLPWPQTRWAMRVHYVLVAVFSVQSVSYLAAVVLAHPRQCLLEAV